MNLEDRLKNPKFLVGFAFVLSCSPSYGEQIPVKYFTKAKLHQLDKKNFKKVHSLYVDLFMKLEKKTIYPNFIKSEYSWSIENLLKYVPDLVENCYADSSGAKDSCLFGGWVSKKLSKGGVCTSPWMARDHATSLSVPSYGPKCGSPNLFRCNPALFGPGPTDEQITKLKLPNGSGAPGNVSVKGGICVEITKKYVGLTQSCSDISKKLEEDNGHSWLEDLSAEDFEKFKKDQFLPIQSYVEEFCQAKASPYNDSTCEELNKKLTEILGKINTEVVVEVVEDANSKITGVVEECPQENVQKNPAEKTPTDSDTEKPSEVTSSLVFNEDRYSKIMNQKSNCYDSNSKDGSELYDALALLMSHPKCSEVDHVGSKQEYVSKGISAEEKCIIKLDKDTSDDGGGSLEFHLDSGQKIISPWDACYRSDMNVSKWFNGGCDAFKGFSKSSEIKEICPDINFKDFEDKNFIKNPDDVISVLESGEEFLEKDSKIAFHSKDKEKVTKYLKENPDIKKAMDVLSKNPDVKYAFLNLSEGDGKFTVGYKILGKDRLDDAKEEIETQFRSFLDTYKKKQTITKDIRGFKEDKDGKGYDYYQYTFYKDKPKEAEVQSDNAMIQEIAPALDIDNYNSLIASMSKCLKGNSANDSDAISMYKALAVILSDPKCAKLKSVKTKQFGKDSLWANCSIRLDKNESRNGYGEFYVNDGSDSFDLTSEGDKKLNMKEWANKLYPELKKAELCD